MKRFMLDAMRLAAGVEALRVDKDTKQPVSEPKWNVLLKVGTYFRPDFPNGKLVIDELALARMVENWKRAGGQGLPIDYHHWGSSENTRVNRDDKVAAGWIEDLKVENGQLLGLTKWTPEALTQLASDQYRYFSPSFSPDAFDRQTGGRQGWTLFGGGLLNDPYLTDLPRLAASDNTSHNPNDSGSRPKETQMNKKLVCAALGLPADATDEQVNAACEKMMEDKKTMSATVEAKVELATKPLAVALKAAEDAKVELSARVEKLEAEKRDTAIAALQTKLMGEGRIRADQQDAVKEYALAMGLEKATKFWSSMPVVVDLKEKGVTSDPKKENDGGDNLVKLNAIAKEIHEKEGTPRSDALYIAMRRNPDLLKGMSSTTPGYEGKGA